MKCANCGKEFGNGVNCQNCGIDRVAGLANYSGYDSHAGSNDSSSYGGQTSPKTTVCYKCSEIIPLGSTFCPVCGERLLVECPNCGHEYSSQYPVCSKCGTNREEYNERKRREENKSDQEIKLKEEASRIRGNYYWYGLLLTGVLEVSSFLFFLIFDASGLISTIGIFAGAIPMILGYKVSEYRIKKWEQEHPNDPRNNYL